MDNSIVRFTHCGRLIYTFDNNLQNLEAQPGEPIRCPLCHDSLRFGLLDAPVIVPSPFRNGHKAPCTFLISSPLGPTFISEQNECELHVGISNTEGVVFSYTESGVQRQHYSWEQSLAIPLVGCNEGPLRYIVPSEGQRGHNSYVTSHPTLNPGFSFRHNWNQQLETFAALDSWGPERFLEEREFGPCCYGFALSFINDVRRSEGMETICKKMFTFQYILPPMTTASKYLWLHQQISHHGYYST